MCETRSPVSLPPGAPVSLGCNPRDFILSAHGFCGRKVSLFPASVSGEVAPVAIRAGWHISVLSIVSDGSAGPPPLSDQSNPNRHAVARLLRHSLRAHGRKILSDVHERQMRDSFEFHHGTAPRRQRVSYLRCEVGLLARYLTMFTSSLAPSLLSSSSGSNRWRGPDEL